MAALNLNSQIRKTSSQSEPPLRHEAARPRPRSVLVCVGGTYRHTQPFIPLYLTDITPPPTHPSTHPHHKLGRGSSVAFRERVSLGVRCNGGEEHREFKPPSFSLFFLFSLFFTSSPPPPPTNPPTHHLPDPFSVRVLLGAISSR